MPPSFYISMPLRDLAADTLGFYRQIGVEAVTAPARYSETPSDAPVRPLVPPPRKAAAYMRALRHRSAP